jgi:hypothetical protein
MNLFGKKKKTISTTDSFTAIQSLKESLNNLDKREVLLTKEQVNFNNEAKIAVKARKKIQALYYLKKAKLHEKQLGHIFNAKMNIEVQISALTQAVTNKDIFNSLQIGKNVLKNMGESLDIDSVGDLMNDIEDNIVSVDEISEVLGQSIGQQYDDDELLRELEEDLMLLEPVVVMPSVPSKNIVDKHDEELRELDRLLCM